MNKKERVIAAMNNQPVDRPPVGFWFHFPGHQSKGEPCVQAHLDYYNHVDVDIAKLMCDGYFDYPNPVAKSAVLPGTGRRIFAGFINEGGVNFGYAGRLRAVEAFQNEDGTLRFEEMKL